MQAAHSIVETCMPTLLMIDTVTAHIIYILHQQPCCLLIMHILHDIDLSWSLPWHRSLMHACCLVKMLSIYSNDTVHMMYVLHIWTCYRLIMPILTWHWTLMHAINQFISTVYHWSMHIIDLWCILFILSDVCYICSRQVLHSLHTRNSS